MVSSPPSFSRAAYRPSLPPGGPVGGVPLRSTRPALNPFAVPAATTLPSPAMDYNPNWPVVDILHTNDFHECYTLLPRLVEAFQTIGQLSEQAGHTVLRLDAGDNNMGQEPEDWALTVRLLNQAQVDAAVPGNKDFDAGEPTFAQAVTQSAFPWLGANLRTPVQSALGKLGQADRWIVGSYVVERGGQRFGLIGVTTPKLLSLIDSQTPMEGVSPVPLPETAQRVQQQVAALERQGVRNIVLLSHMGYAADKALINPQQGAVTGVDVIVGGHSHTVLQGIVPGKTLFHDAKGQPVLVLQTGQNAQAIGHAQLQFDPAGHVHPLSVALLPVQAFPEATDAKAAVENRFGPQQPFAWLAQPYDNTGIHRGEDPMADLAADSLRQKTGADIAFIAAPTLKTGADAGGLTQLHLREMTPYTAGYVLAQATGEQLLQALADIAQAKQAGQPHPDLLHPSCNFRYTLDAANGTVVAAQYRQAETGQWQPLPPQQTFRIALDPFPLTGQDYPSLHGLPVVQHTTISLRQLLAEGLYQQQAAHPNQPITLPQDGRVQLLHRQG